MSQQAEVLRKADALDKLDAVAGRNSWENLQEAFPEVAAAISNAVDLGVTSETIYGRLLRNHGLEFCKWCRTAARYLESMRDVD